MTKKKLKFVDEYLKDQNQTQAAIRAGFSERTARAAGSRLMADVNVLALINQRLEVVRATNDDGNQFNHAEIRKYFMAIYDRCMQGAPVMRWDNLSKQFVPLTDEDGNAVWQFDANGANRAMENIAKNKGFYELDNSQKKSVIQIAIVNNGNADPQDTGDTGQITDNSVFTLLPPTTEK